MPITPYTLSSVLVRVWRQATTLLSAAYKVQECAMLHCTYRGIEMEADSNPNAATGFIMTMRFSKSQSFSE